MSLPVPLRCTSSPFSQCTACSLLRVQPSIAVSTFDFPKTFRSFRLQFHGVSRFRNRRNVDFGCRMSGTETEPDSNDDNEKDTHESGESTSTAESSVHSDSELKQENELVPTEVLNSDINIITNSEETEIDGEGRTEGADDLEVTSGSPLPGVKPQQLDETIRIPKATIDILRDQVFGFDTFFVTGQEPYEGGVLFKGNLRGVPAKSYEKISKRMQERLGDEYKLFLLTNPEDDKPVAVVVPRKTLQPETTAVPEWFAAGAFGLVTVFTLLLRNVPALQSNLLYVLSFLAS